MNHCLEKNPEGRFHSARDLGFALEANNPTFLWVPDGRALIYVDTRGDVSNLWTQRIEGGTPKQITDFKQGRIFSFDYSPDGKQIALSRGTINNDVVMISNFK